MRLRIKVLLLVFVIGVFGTVQKAFGVEQGELSSETQSQADLLDRSKLSGNWGGLRDDLADNGITINIDALQSYQGVLHGGVEKNWKYGGSVDYEFKFDFQKMGLWPGAFVDARIEHQFGEFINSDTGSILATNADGFFPLPDYRELTVSKLMFTQFLSESFGVFFGKIDTLDGDNNHFAGGRGKENFMNQNFVLNPVALRTTPYSSLGAGLVFVLPDVHAKDPAMLSVMALGANGQPNIAGWDDDFEDGTVYAGEYSQPTNFFNLPGKQLVGATYSNKDFTALDQDRRLILRTLLGLDTLREDEGSWCFYYNFHQYLFTEENDETQGLGIFGRLGFADDETSPIKDFYSIGLGGKGLLEGRDNDRFGVGYYHIGLSDELGTIISNRFGDSDGFEVFYNIEITKSLHITPDFQIINPSNESRDTAYIAGFRVKIDF